MFDKQAQLNFVANKDHAGHLPCCGTSASQYPVQV